MEHLPVEMQEIILNHFLWDNIEELYRLRVVSRAWKCMIDGFITELFATWYNRCQSEIPEDHLLDIIQAKYPLKAHPWQENYWVDRGLPHVARDAYLIWKSFPDNLAKIPPINRTKKMPWRLCLTVKHPIEYTSIGVNDKYLAASCHDYEYDEDDEDDYIFYNCSYNWGTRFFRWDHPKQLVRHYNITSEKIDFYTTKNGTFAVLGNVSFEGYEIHMSKYPIDNPDLSSELISLGQCKGYFITQNECFYLNVDDSTSSVIIEHKILTDHGFETNTIIGPLAGVTIPQFSMRLSRIEISGSTLYILNTVQKISVFKYRISRNSAGKLSFTPEGSQVLGNGIFHSMGMGIEYSFAIGSAVACEDFHSWLVRVFDRDLKTLIVYGNFVFGVAHGSIHVFQKDHLIQRITAADVSDDIPFTIATIPSSGSHTVIHWIRIVYIGFKAKLLVSYDRTMCLVDFY